MRNNSFDASANQGAVRANIVDCVAQRIFAAEVSWHAGYITQLQAQGDEDPALPYLIPGWVDAHVHVESSMLTPCEFARLAVRHGTVAAVSDPHEIANVLGLAGVEYMLANARLTPFTFCFGAPSCVPATPFESAGGRLDCADIETLFQTQQASYLAEMMNYPAVLAQEPEVWRKIQLAQRYGCKIDGHAPGLTGAAVTTYAQAGISTDHECSSLQEAEEKLAAGMQILIREGSAARNFAALHPLISRYPERVMFCSDDKHPDDLALGHINVLAARARAEGHSIFAVLRCAALNAIQHYALPIGRLRLGDPMDAVQVQDLQTLTPQKTWLAGCLVAEQGRSLLPVVHPAAINRFQPRPLRAQDLSVKAHGQVLRVIQALDGELLTREVLLTPKIQAGCIVADPTRDILLLTVVNRYQRAKPAIAFIRGFGLQHGALASSVAHDSHNIIAVGTDAEAVCQAINGVIASQGGIATYYQQHLTSLPLPIAGLMSDQDGDWVAQRYATLDATAKQMGSTLRAPFMTLSFMALLVIPELKLSDLGLFDGRTFEFTSLEV